MAVAGGFNIGMFTKGPGKLFFGTGVPGADQFLASVTSGVPDAGRYVGYTVEGNEIGVGYEEEEVNADEAPTAIEKNISAENLTITGTAFQIEDINLLQAMFPTATYSDKTTYDLLKWGGRATLATAAQIAGMLLTWPSRTAAKYVRFMLYDALNQAQTTWKVTKAGFGQMQYVFKGRALSGRAAGDQIGHFAIDK